MISVIVKCANEEGGVKEGLEKELHLFEKEAEMFSRTFPAMYDILGKSICSDGKISRMKFNWRHVITVNGYSDCRNNEYSGTKRFQKAGNLGKFSKISEIHQVAIEAYYTNLHSITQ